MSRRATDEAMDAIHAEIASILTQELHRAKEATDDQGKPKPVSNELLKNAMKFLKDNGVDAPARSPRLSKLAQELSEIDLDEAAAERLPN